MIMPKAAKDIHEALQQGKHGPDKDGPEIDAFRTKAVKQPAARDLSDHIGP